ncbi:MAG: hypothetical protein H0V43_06075 [Gemmatimonadales bacterium]|nr:hypothetical protein [Gemmatimonadales bacterium]
MAVADAPSERITPAASPRPDREGARGEELGPFIPSEARDLLRGHRTPVEQVPRSLALPRDEVRSDAGISTVRNAPPSQPRSPIGSGSGSGSGPVPQDASATATAPRRPAGRKQR